MVLDLQMLFDRETMPGWMKLPDPKTFKADVPFEVDYVRTYRTLNSADSAVSTGATTAAQSRVTYRAPIGRGWVADPIRVTCVGDSITSMACASKAAMA
jgi:hypothetical protein